MNITSTAHNRGLADALDLYVISLRHRTDRRDWMIAQADNIGLALTFFDAINGTEQRPDVFASQFQNHGPLGAFGAGDMACTLSHLKIFEQFLAGPKTHCVVFEDDARLARDLGEWLNDLSWFPPDADIVKLEACSQKGLVVLLGRTSHQHLGRDLRSLLSRHTGAAGYLITRAAAQMVLDSSRPINMPIDHLLFNANISSVAQNMQIYQVTPALVRQDETAGISDLDDMRGETLPTAIIWRRELKRGLSEISRLPQQLFALIAQGARLVEISWVSKINSQSNQKTDRSR